MGKQLKTKVKTAEKHVAKDVSPMTRTGDTPTKTYDIRTAKNMDKLEIALSEGDHAGLNVAVEKMWEYEQVCDIWRHLPGYAASEFRFVRTTEPEDELAFYPVLRRHGIGLEFRSGYFHGFGVIRMQKTDVLAWCPQKCVWVFCFCCQRFLFPPQGHRRSKKHQSTLEWSKYMTADELYRWYVRKERVTRPLYHHGDDTMPTATSEV